MNEKVFFCPNEKENGQLITCKCLRSIQSDLFVSDARLNLQHAPSVLAADPHALGEL